MSYKLALSAIGRDRPGIVAQVTGVLFDAGCNLEDSSMTLLGGEFAMILLIEVPDNVSTRRLDEMLDKVRSSLGLTISLRPLSDEEAGAKRNSTASPWMISVYGADKPGIVHKVTSFLAGLGVNITDLETHLFSGAREPVYVLVIEAEAPPTLTQETFDEGLQKVAESLQVKITLRPIEPESL